MSVASSYASALYEAARDTKVASAELDAIERQLADLVRLIQASKEARVALESPATGAREKAAIIEQIATKAQAAPLLKRFLIILAQKERLPLLESISDAFSEVRITSEGGVLGKIVSADPMEQGDVDGLAKAFTQKLGKRVAFQTSTDPELLAGMKVTVNGVTYDGTLKSQLQRLRDRLLVNTEMVH